MGKLDHGVKWRVGFCEGSRVPLECCEGSVGVFLKLLRGFRGSVLQVFLLFGRRRSKDFRHSRSSEWRRFWGAWPRSGSVARRKPRLAAARRVGKREPGARSRAVPELRSAGRTQGHRAARLGAMEALTHPADGRRKRTTPGRSFLSSGRCGIAFLVYRFASLSGSVLTFPIV